MRTIMSSWQEVADELLKDEDFAADLQKENNWLNDDIKSYSRRNNKRGKREKIFEFVGIVLPAPIIMQYIFHSPSKNLPGKNVADINMLLTAMMLSAGFEAHPVLSPAPENMEKHTTSIPSWTNSITLYRRWLLTEIGACSMPQTPICLLKELPAKCYNGNARLLLNCR